MTDRQLRLFLSVVEKGSFSKAEEAEHISKQAILRQINGLEAEVGAALFRRTAKGVTLTEVGETFLRGAEELVRLHEKVLSDCRSVSAGKECLRLDQTEHRALLHEVTTAFIRRYPDIHIERTIHPNHSSRYRVSHDITDVGEAFYASMPPSARAIGYTRLVDLPYLAVVAPGHPLSGREQVGLEDLTEYTTMAFQPMLPPGYLEVLRRTFIGKEDRLLLRKDVDHQVEAVFECISKGYVFLTASYFVRTLSGLCLVPLDTGWRQEYGIIYRTPPTPAVQKYVDLAVSIYGEKWF